MADTAKIVIEAEDRASNVLGGIASSLGGIAKIATGALVGGLGAAAVGLAASVKAAGDFESTLNRFSAVTGVAGQDLQQFNNIALKMGADTQFSAAEAADAMVELAKGGISPAEIAAGTLEQTLGLAAAGELDLATAAGITAKQLGVWATEADKANGTAITAAEVANLMSQAANASTVDVDELALGMANVGGVAKVAGLSFKETTQAMALLAPGFSSAADAGTSFKAFLNNLIPTSKSAITAAEDLGLVSLDTARAIEELSRHGIDASKFNTAEIEDALARVGAEAGMTKNEVAKFVQGFSSSAFYDASGQFVGMEEAARLLQDATKDLTQEEKSLALETIFGADAQRAAALLAEGGAAGYDKMGVAMDGAGSAAEQAAKRNQGFNFAIESMKGSIENVAIVIGQKLLPMATEIITKFITPAINGFGKLVGALDPFIQYLTKDSAIGFQTFKNIVSDVFGPVMGQKIAAFAQEFKQVLANAQAWIQANWPAIQQTIGSVINGVVAFINDPLIPIFNVILTKVGEVISWIVTHWPEISAAISTVIQGIVAFINDPLLPILSKIIEAAGAVISWIVTHWPEISAVIGTVINAIVAIINDPLLPIIGAIIAAAVKVVEWFITNWPQIVTTFETVFNNVKTSVEKEVAAIKRIILAGVAIVTAIQVELDKIKTAFDTTWSNILTAMTMLPRRMVETGQNIIQGLINGVTAKLKVFADLFDKLGNDPVNALKDILQIHSPSEVMYDMGSNIVQGLINGVDDYADAFTRAATRMANDAVLAAQNVVAQPIPLPSLAAPYSGDLFDRHPDMFAAAAASAAAGGAIAPSGGPAGMNASFTINFNLDGNVLQSAVVNIVQGALEAERARYGQ